jgi:uncharacterized protein
MTATVTGLFIYPVKSLQGIALDEAVLTGKGLQYDRNWMIIDSTGLFITQRLITDMATIRVKISGEALILEHPNAEPLPVALKREPGRRVATTVWGNAVEGLDEGDEVSRWLTGVLGRWKGNELRLLRFAPDFVRAVETDYMDGQTASTAFADGYPFLVTNVASLGQLNDRLIAGGSDPVPMSRFRPNIVIKGLEPFAEDRLGRLRADGTVYELALRKPCKRCKVTTVDQQTGIIEEPKEPLKTLTLMNRHPGRHGAFFGQNATLESGEGETIKVGDHLAWIQS